MRSFVALAAYLAVPGVCLAQNPMKPVLEFRVDGLENRVAVGVAEDPMKPVFELSFQTLRDQLPADGVVVEVMRKQGVWPKETGEYKDEWVQVCFGKRLKVHPADRTERNETSLGAGVTLDDGCINVALGWRARKKLDIENNFDGTLTARLAVFMSGGKWQVRVVSIKSHWGGGFPGLAEAVNSLIEAVVRGEVEGGLAKKLDEATEKFLGPVFYALLKPKLSELSGALVGDRVVFRTVPLEPLCDLGRVVHARGAKKITLGAKNYDKMTVAIIDRSVVEAVAATVYSSLVIGDKIDGQSAVGFNCAPGASVTVKGRVDGQSSVVFIAPGGHVNFRERIDGQSIVTVMAPHGHVEFHDRIDGQSRLTVFAKTVTFHKKIDGGQKTVVNLFLPDGGSASCPEYNGVVTVTHQQTNPNAPKPTVAFANRNRDGRLEVVTVQKK